MKLSFSLILILLTNLTAARSAALVEQSPSAPSAPPRDCEVRQRAWCMYQEGSEITDEQKTDNHNPNIHIWTMRDVYHPNSTIVILEPEGCRNGFANEVTSLGFDESIKWKDNTWDQMKVRLKKDGSCDLRLLVPLFDGDPLEWAFSVGRTLIGACRNEQCDPVVPTLADVTEQYRKRFRRQDFKP